MSRQPQHNPLPVQARELLDLEGAAQLLGVGVESIKSMRLAHRFPFPIRWGPNGGGVRWRRRELQTWVRDGCPEVGDERYPKWKWEPAQLRPLEELLQEKRRELAELEQEIRVAHERINNGTHP